MTHATIRFPGGHRAAALRVAPDTPAPAIIATLALPRPRAVLILNGGTQGLTGQLAARLGAVLGDGLARVVAGQGITVITGGTDAGIFHLFGDGLARWGRTAPCIGVVVDALVAYPGHLQGEAALEPHHSHFVLVEGATWGDETETMYGLVAELANGCPSVAVFAGGGEIAIREMQANVAQGRRMILLAGSGRATDAVLAVRAGAPTDDLRLAEIAKVGALVRWDLQEDQTSFQALVHRSLFGL